jgi:glycerol-3-phosphate dehydrogenase
MQPVALSPEHRERSLTALTDDELDVLVVGGGVVGAGCALDAATRGLKVGLVEARDLAAGTSSRSSKLIHGGLRYLEMLDFGLVAEALHERDLLAGRLAPHLVRPVPFLYPLRHHVWERVYVGAGVGLYDGLAALGGRSASIPRHRHLTRRRALALAPSLRRDALVGAIQYHDCQVDDARFVVSLARTAASYGASVATRTRVVELTREGDRMSGALVRDEESGSVRRVRARHVVLATGVWSDDVQALGGARPAPPVRASKGVHLVVPRDRIRSETGLILRTETSVLFVIPWGRHWIVGTTDTDWDLDKADPAATDRDIEYLLARVNEVLVDPLDRDDIEGVYVGLRPLLAGDDEATAKLSREHAVATPAPGLVTVAGGKYTTYRVMARDAIDAVVRGMPADGRGLGPVPPSCTDDVRLVGAEGFEAVWNARHLVAQEAGLSAARLEHLLHRYGSAVDEVLQLIADDPGLGEPVVDGEDYLRAEVVHAVSHESARHLEDVLDRRTHLSVQTFDRGAGCAEQVARLMAGPLGWDGARIAREVDLHRSRVQAELASQRLPDDASADALLRAARPVAAGASNR